MGSKRQMKTLLAGILLGALLTSVIVPAAAGGLSETIGVLLNSVNVKVDNTVLAKENEDYTLASGEKVPYSIVYKGTTYLPMRVVAESVGKEVGWDGASNTASIKDKTPQYVNPSDDEKQELSINVVKIDGKYYELATKFTSGLMWGTGFRYCIVDGKSYLATNTEEGVIRQCDYYSILLLNKYKLVQGHDNPNLSGRIELYDLAKVYENKERSTEFEGAAAKSYTRSYSFDFGQNRQLKLTFVADATKYDTYIEQMAEPQGIYVNLDFEDPFAIDLAALHEYLSIKNLPKVYYDETMKCYVMELFK